MKRNNELDNTNSTSEDFLTFVKEQNFDREKFLDALKEVNQQLSLECSMIACAIPEEVWKVIIMSSSEFLEFKNRRAKERSYYEIELLFKKLSCVSLLFSRIVYQLIREYFNLSHYVSNWTLRHFEDLRELDLFEVPGANNVTDSALEKLSNLKWLQLHVGQAITDDGIKFLTNLKFLNANESLITDEGICHLTKLKHLMVHGECFGITDAGLRSLENLTALDVSNNSNITGTYFSCLKNLEYLEMEGDSAVSEEALVSLNDEKMALEALVLRDNEYVTDEILRKLTKIVDLDLASNELITDHGISVLTNLEILCLAHNNLITLEGIRNLTKLTHIDLTGNIMISENDLSIIPTLEKEPL